MEDFLKLYETKKERLNLSIGYSRGTDWSVCVHARANGEDAPPIVWVQDCDRRLAFAKAYVALAEWLSDAFGGY